MNIIFKISEFIGNGFTKFPLILPVYYLIINIISMSLFYVDKQRAVKHQWRISEFTLLLSAFMGGSFGAAVGMKIFRHKTKHPKFYILIPTFLIIHILIIIIGIIGLLK